MKRLLLLAGIWGWSFLFIKVAVEGLTPPTVAFGRVALGAATLLLVLRLRGERMPADRRLWVHFLVVGLFGSALPFTLLAWGEERITSALTAVLNATTPMFTALAATWVLRDRLRAPHAAGLVLGLMGVTLAAGFGGSDLSHSSVSGSAAAVVAGASYGFAFTWMRRHLTGIPPIVAATGQLVSATLPLLPVALATSAASGFSLDVRRAAAMAALGVLGTGVAYVLNYRIIAELGATRASLVTYVVPVVAVTAGILVLDEPFEVGIVVGGVLIVAGIGLVHERWKAKPSGWSRRRTPLTSSSSLLVVVLVSIAVLAGCGGSSGGAADESASACSSPRREKLDTNLGHVLPGADEPTYLSDPPTSGQHQPSPPQRGMLDRPLSRPVQVGQLEEGGVLVQYRDLSADELAELEPLAADELVGIAPNDDLPGDAKVVATAWVWKQTCTAVDVAALEAFVADHGGKGPGHR